MVYETNVQRGNQLSHYTVKVTSHIPHRQSNSNNMMYDELGLEICMPLANSRQPTPPPLLCKHLLVAFSKVPVYTSVVKF